MPIKNFSVIISAAIFAILLIGAVVFIGNDKNLTYKAESSSALKIDLAQKDQEKLADWEKDILSRQENTVPRTNGAYAENVAKSVLEEYLKIREANSALNEEKIIESVLSKNPVENLFSGTQNQNEYKVTSLKIVADNSPEKLKNYATKVGEIALKNIYDTAAGNEMDILKKAMEQNSEAELQKLDPIIKNYKTIAEELLKLEVPSSIAEHHLELINGFNNLAWNASRFKIFIKDPLGGVAALSEYVGSGVNLYEALVAIDSNLKNSGIIFKETDPGYTIERAIKIREELLKA